MRVTLFTILSAGVAAQEICSPKNISAAGAPCHGYDCLKQYVEKADPTYTWVDTGLRLHGTHPKLSRYNWTGYVLNVTSQAWLTPADFNFTDFGGRPIGHIWWHNVVVIVPNNLRESNGTAFLYMTGGDNDNPHETPSADSEDLLLVSNIAMQSGCIGVGLFQVPRRSIA